MKRIAVLALIAGALVMAGCASKPAEQTQTLPPAPEYVERTDTYQVIDHKTKAVGQDVPEWVTRYISDGVSGVEAMPQYNNKYVFIGEDSGTNLNALRQWSTGFTVAQDLSRMVSSRVQARFAGAAAGSPDDEYGRYFENVVKSASDATYSGARKETDFWLLKRYFKADGKTVDREVYDFYVLVSIDKDLLQRQINDILDGVNVDTPPTREQSTAIDRVKEAFYEGF
ncbi:hypothetical protein [Breznakiella homolactica]|uniref:Lipoprotein n=1 Tax=Breznakiella homolactica TaxID=2798577 RepID=A0A7T7XN15_9SPIR|nr:hypothetical protein [Breznakiella homolactica]QQO09247.1 hypothetical protein JFL75_20335 [Breznakiella homolactica]